MKPYQLGLYEKSMPNTLSLPEKLRECKAAGFDYLELSIDETDEKLARLDWTPAQRKELVDAMCETGVPIKSICLSGHRRFPLGSQDAATEARGLEIMEQAVALSAQLGVRIIQLAGYDVYYEEASERTVAAFARNLRKAAEMAAREGVLLGFETMETEFMNTTAKAMRWVREIDSPYLQVYPDIGNLTNAAVLYGTSVVDDLRTGTGHLPAVHLKETVPGVFREVPYGTGHVDFGTLTAEALRLGVRMFVGEFWHVGEENWREVLAGNGRFLRGWLDGVEL